MFFFFSLRVLFFVVVVVSYSVSLTMFQERKGGCKQTVLTGEAFASRLCSAKGGF